MILKLIKAVASSFYWVRANSSLWDGEDDEALRYLNKSIKIISRETLDYTLLKGFIFFRKRQYPKAISTMKVALEKIEGSERLDKDDKIYLTAYAKDIINFSIVHGNVEMGLMPVDLNFDLDNVRDIYKKRHRVILEGRSQSREG